MVHQEDHELENTMVNYASNNLNLDLHETLGAYINTNEFTLIEQTVMNL